MNEQENKDILHSEIEEELEDLEGSKDGVEEDYDEDQEEDEVLEIDFKNKTVKLNMLKKRAKKAPDITDDIWKLCNKENRAMYDEYFSTQKQLSEDTRTQYRTCLKQFFYFVYTDLNDKPLYKITKRDFMKFMAYLQDRELSSSAIGLRKSSVSSLCNYVENIVADDDENYATFRNFTRGMPPIPKTQTYSKEPVTLEEYELMKKYFLQHKKYLPLAYLVTLWGLGCRRSEAIQFKTEILDYEVPEGATYIMSHTVRGKGAGKDGKPLEYMIPLEVLDYWRLYVENRDFESDYIFARLNENGEPIKISRQWSNRLCERVLSKIVGRRITNHNFKATIVTRMLESGIDMAIVSKEIAHHNDVATTQSFYDLRKFEDKKKQIFDNMTI